MMEEKIKEENIEKCVFISTVQKHLQSNQYKKIISQNPSQKNKIRIFYFSILDSVDL